MFKTIEQIKQAVDNGRKVFWKQNNYEVIKDTIGQYLVFCSNNGHCVGLTWTDGKTSEYDPKDFYTL